MKLIAVASTIQITSESGMKVIFFCNIYCSIELTPAEIQEHFNKIKGDFLKEGENYEPVYIEKNNYSTYLIGSDKVNFSFKLTFRHMIFSNSNLSIYTVLNT